jgi:ADP-heptose:LPS heptosyltransferase
MDPHISGAIIQRTGQISQKELHEYWIHLGRGFNRVINLSESAERTLLAVQGDKAWRWNKEFRDLMFSVDYLDAVHAIANVMDEPRWTKFYPTKNEIRKAISSRHKLGMRNKVVMWVLSGSSVHKSYPFTDNVVARLMLEMPDVRVIFVGDQLCQILDDAWRNEPRVSCKSGRWTIRQTLAFVPQCDAVVGPETGVMQAAAFEDMPKILMLSHASRKNLVWPNTTYLAPEGCDCYPCHKLHYGWSTCNRDPETGAAMCAARIAPSRVYDAIRSAI